MRILLLDLDDTIYDFHRSEAHALTQTLQSIGVPATPANMQLYSRINDALWKALERGEVTREVLRLERFHQFFDALGIEGNSEAAAHHYETQLAQTAIFIEGAESLLQELHRCYRLALVTNGITQIQKGRLARGAIASFFEAIFISQEIGFNKPDPRFFEHVFETLDITDRSEVAIIGDSLTSDMKGGLAAGITTIWYNGRRLENLSSIQPDYEIRHLSELVPLLKRL